MLDIFIIVIGIIYGMALCFIFPLQSADNSFKESWRGTQNNWFDNFCEYLHLPYYETKNGSKIYTAFYTLFWMIILIACGIKILYSVTIGNIFKSIEQNNYNKKLLISLADIYSFEQKDIIRLKNGKKIYLWDFSPSGFSDASKNVYSWIQAAENITAKARKELNNKNIQFEIFAKEAKDFKVKVDEFRNQMAKQKKELLDKLR